MSRSLVIPAFVGLLFAILATACGTAPAAAPNTAVPAPNTAVPAPNTAVPAPPTTAAATEAPAAERIHTPSEVFVSANSPQEAGEYLIWLGGCNECHTAGWSGVGQTPKDDWLTGNVRFDGSYGTTHSANLRLVPEEMSAAEFVDMMRTRTLNPPMPWAHFHELNEKDLLAVYSFLESLGQKGDEELPFVPAPKESPTSGAAVATATPAPTATLVPEALRPAPPANAFLSAPSPELAGEYFIWVGHCNECHTPNWSPATPKEDWLTGGVKLTRPDGVIYSGNLRLVPGEMSEDEFVAMMRTRTDHAPMPWVNFHQLNEKDLRALYRFFKILGPKGEEPPAFVPTT